MDKKAGIWIDKTQAQLFILKGHEEHYVKIESQVEDTHPKGGSGSSTPWGPQDAISESRLTERKKHQFKSFFKDIMGELSGVNELYILGPAEAKTMFKKLFEEYSIPKPNLVGYEACDSITQNQIRARIKKFYKDRATSTQ